jgi:hypothetical protein
MPTAQYKKVSVYAKVSFLYNIWQLYLDKSYITTEMLLPDEKKFIKGSIFFVEVGI